MSRTVNRLILVYNGDSGLRAMLLDALKKAVGREECSLCEMTYSSFGKRRSWVTCAARLGVPVEELHRDEIPPTWGISRTDLPCVLGGVSEATPIVVLTREEITACRGSVAELERRLAAALGHGARS
jgi:hypothetical protein